MFVIAPVLDGSKCSIREYLSHMASDKIPDSTISLLKRVFLSGLEVGLLMFGVVLTIVLSVGLKSATAFFLGLALTPVGLMAFRKRTRKWEIEYDAARWMAMRARRQANPKRDKFLRLIHRCLLWFPSACAAMALFFFPVVSHVVHPCSYDLKHYRVTVPWTFAAVPAPWLPEGARGIIVLANSSGVARYGVTPFWGKKEAVSMMAFESTSPDTETIELNHTEGQLEREGAIQVTNRDFRVGNVPLTCWQYHPKYYRGFQYWMSPAYDNRTYWESSCETPVVERARNLHALFQGRKQDLSAFYDVIQKITQID